MRRTDFRANVPSGYLEENAVSPASSFAGPAQAAVSILYYLSAERGGVVLLVFFAQIVIFLLTMLIQ
ncbi:MAG: hypothetical protein JSU95_19320 [Betaproteobacteria bacterium]|nr:MAG: hypothetical protein JSU95_19320 [Betaproteobacteria bacterium]